MTYISTIIAIALVSSSMVAMTHVANAASSSSDSTKTAVSKKVKPSSSLSLAGQTDIVANVDMPMVTNILPWQEKEGSIAKNILEFSALKDSLTPTDRDRLAGEIRYTSILNQPIDQK